MKKAILVLVSPFILLAGLLLVAGTIYWFRLPVSKDVFTGVLSVAVFVGALCYMVIAVIATALIHEVAHYYFAKRYGFRILFVEVLGFRKWVDLPTPVYRFSWSRGFFGKVALGKKGATPSEIRRILLAGPASNIAFALILYRVGLLGGIWKLLDTAIWLNACIGIINLVPTGTSDGALALMSYKKPEELVRLFDLSYESIELQALRPRTWSLDHLTLTGEPMYDATISINRYYNLMDCGKVIMAEPYIHAAMNLVINNEMRSELASIVIVEAIVYYSRFNEQRGTARNLIQYARWLKLSKRRKLSVDGSKLWLEGRKAEAIRVWQKSNELFNDEVVHESNREHCKEWFLRLRTENMIFETDRLFARPWTIEDVDDAFAIYGNAEVMRYLGRDPKTPASKEEMHELLTRWIEKEKDRKPGHGAWALVRKEDEKPVGTIMCKSVPDGNNEPTDEVELGWHLGQQYWGNGYATEAARTAAEYGFSALPEVERFLAVIYPENLASKKVASNIGMQPIGQSDEFYGITLDVFELRRPTT